MQRRKTLLSWSSGKDSAWALHALRQDPAVELVGLLTTLNESFARVAMHAVRETLLERQAQAAGLPLWKIPLPYPCPNEAYERIMAGVIQRAQSEGVEAMAFGDLFLEDIRAYREHQLDGTGLEPLFPIWGIPTDELARTMVAAGLRAHVTCVDPRQLDRSFAGRVFDAQFLADLPAGVDPCGENGEFHSFATDGPMFSKRLEVQTGEVVERDGFVFADLL
ncbi:MAG: adenine nucleotide alpha hydrolase [Deltaproteobacteria bacterium]|nr:adenine nucleotide alpha hydrolase [Deltaproteobacteria bacterium]